MSKWTEPSTKAFREMAYAMSYFLSIGWRKQDLDMLEQLWWQVRDFDGKVREASLDAGPCPEKEGK